MNEYAVADSIYHLQNDEKGNGWCFASKEYLAAFLGISKRTIITIIRKLFIKGLIAKTENGRNLKVTNKWYNIAIVTNGEDSSPKRCSFFTKNGEDSSPNNNTNNNNITKESFSNEKELKRSPSDNNIPSTECNYCENIKSGILKRYTDILKSRAWCPQDKKQCLKAFNAIRASTNLEAKRAVKRVFPAESYPKSKQKEVQTYHQKAYYKFFQKHIEDHFINNAEDLSKNANERRDQETGSFFKNIVNKFGEVGNEL